MQGQGRPDAGRNVPLVAGRILAGVAGVVQLGGFGYFTFIGGDAIFLGPAIDIPVVGALVVGLLLKLACAVWPGLSAGRRIVVGLAGAALGIATTLIKIPVYDEPEGVVFLVVDAVLIGLLLLARRSARSRSTGSGQVKVPA